MFGMTIGTALVIVIAVFFFRSTVKKVATVTDDALNNITEAVEKETAMLSMQHDVSLALRLKELKAEVESEGVDVEAAMAELNSRIGAKRKRR